LLGCSEWGLMKVYRTFHQSKAPTKFSLKRLGVIPHYVETTAFRGAFWSERANNHVAARLDSVSNLPNVSDTLLWSHEEMKYRSVVPNVIDEWLQLYLVEDVADQPTHTVCPRTQSLLGDGNRGL
jgi:hypothetical protein